MSFGSATLKPRYWSQVILETSIVTCAWPAVAARNAIRIIILIVLMTARFMIGLHQSVRMTVYRWLHALKIPARVADSGFSIAWLRVRSTATIGRRRRFTRVLACARI